jgi:hypothetical protein
MIGLAKNGAGTWDIALHVDIGWITDSTTHRQVHNTTGSESTDSNRPREGLKMLRNEEIIRELYAAAEGQTNQKTTHCRRSKAARRANKTSRFVGIAGRNLSE